MRTTAKVDYAVRAALELAKAQPTDSSRGNPVKGHDVAQAQEIPVKFLESILAEPPCWVRPSAGVHQRAPPMH